MINSTAYRLGAKRSCIRDLFEYGQARAALVGEENVFDYSLGNPSIPAPEAIGQTIRDILRDTDSVKIHGYTSSAGDGETRAAISRELNRRFGIQSGPEDFFIGCGAAGELCAVFRALAVPGAELIALAPYFPEYRPFAESAGLRFREVSPDIPHFQINFSQLSEAIGENTQIVLLNSPNNPSGVVYSRETLETLAKLLREKSAQYGHPIYLVSDEPYRELAYGVEVPFVPNFYDNTVICYSYSKSLSLPGERIGYIYVPKAAADSRELFAAIAGAARSMGHVCAPSLLQKVLTRCAELKPDLSAYDRNRKLLYESLTDMGYEMPRPDGAFYLFVKAPGGDAKAFSERAKQRDLLVVPGDDFGCPGYFRLCYCIPYEKIQRSLPLFQALI